MKLLKELDDLLEQQKDHIEFLDDYCGRLNDELGDMSGEPLCSRDYKDYSKIHGD